MKTLSNYMGEFVVAIALLFTGVLIMTTVSCGAPVSEQRTRVVCNCEEKKALQSFVENSIADANNMSDEEMEDVVHQLTVDGSAIHCHKEPVWIKGGSWDIDWTKETLDSCRTIMDW